MSTDRSKVNIARVDGLEERLQEIEQKLSTGLTVGQVIWSQSSRREDNPGCLPLFTGDHVSTEDYSGLHAFLLNNPANVTTKAIYDVLAANTEVDCPYYALDNGQIYLPILRNYLNTVYASDESGESGTELVVEKTNLYPWVCFILQVDDYVTPIGYVRTAGDVMTGDLTMSGGNKTVYLDADGDGFHIFSAKYQGKEQLRLYNKATGAGLYINSNDSDRPYYWDGSTAYKLLNVSDISSIGSNLEVNWDALTAIADGNFTAPSAGFVYGYAGASDYSGYTITVNGTTLQNHGTGEYNHGSSFSVFVGKGETIYVHVQEAGAWQRCFVPLK